MKKISLSILATVFAINFSYAQWTTSGSNIYYNSGNVGIGTTAPANLLTIMQPTSGATNLRFVTADASNSILFQRGSTLYNSIFSPYATPGDFAIYDNVNSVARFYVNPSGNVGIGTTSPQNKWVVSDGTAGLEINPNATISSATGAYIASYNRSTSAYADIIFDNGGSYTVFKAGGNVGIGTTTPDQLLSVNGNIHAQEVLVNLTGFEDRVFKRSYHLPTLNAVKTYIDKNHHLPDVPSEAEVVKDGLKVGNMERVLTKKVEELTLYLIEKDKQITQQQATNQILQKQIDELKKQVSAIIKPKL